MLAPMSPIASPQVNRTVVQEQPYSEKLQPQNIEAEQSVLGSLLIDNDAMIKIADIISADDFYKPSHQKIYDACMSLYEKKEPIDILSLASTLEDRNHLNDIGGRSYIAHLANAVPTASNIRTYATLVQKKATLRRLIHAAHDITSLGYKEDSELDELLDQAEQQLFGVSQKYLKQNFIPIGDLLAETFERIDELHNEGGGLRGIPTGFKELDGLLAGLQRSDLVVLAARPSMGKTTFALDMIRHIGMREKLSVGLFSLEVSKEQIADKLLCADAGVSLWKMRNGKLSDKEEMGESDFAKLGHAFGRLSEAKIHIDDSGMVNVMEIRTKARRLASEHGLDLIVIDYLQLIDSHGREENRVQEVAKITRSLKALARELNVPIIALSQLSRAVESRSPSIPNLADLRESGAIEQDADVVMFIYRKARDRTLREIPEDEKHVGNIIIAKHRNGPCGQIDVFFDEETVSFKNLAKKAHAGQPVSGQGPFDTNTVPDAPF